MRILFLLALALSLTACGVKLPPIAPEKTPERARPANLDCSPTDPDCDKTDPKYQPAKPR